MSHVRASSAVKPIAVIAVAIGASPQNTTLRCRRDMSSALRKMSSGVFAAIFSWSFGVGSASSSATSRTIRDTSLYSVVPSAFVPPMYTGWPHQLSMDPHCHQKCFTCSLNSSRVVRPAARSAS